MSNYKYVLIDEFGGAVRKFASKVEATPYLTGETRLEPLGRHHFENHRSVYCTDHWVLVFPRHV